MSSASDITRKLAGFITSATGRPCYWVEQDRPVLDRPHVGLHLLSLVPIMLLPERRRELDGTCTVITRFRIGVSVQLVAVRAGLSNRDAAVSLCDYLVSPQGLQGLRDIGLRLIRIGTVREHQTGGDILSIDLDLSWVRAHTEPFEPIDSVELELEQG